MLRYIRGMDLQTSPFPPFRGRDRLIAAVDAAMSSGDPERITADLQLALQEAITDNRIELPECVHRPVSDHYARRPLYHSREHGYSVIAMSWGPGQGTPLHDHDAMWCVEGVWLGELEITRYELLECAGERWRFRRHAALRGGCGSAGSLIPPHEYHTLRNASDEALAISVHVYGGVRSARWRLVPAPHPGAAGRPGLNPARCGAGHHRGPHGIMRRCAAGTGSIRDALAGKEQDDVQR